MISIKNLFEDTENSSVPKKYRKRLSKKIDVFEGFEETVPEFRYPQENTLKFEEDLDEVRRCVKNPSLSKKMLDITNKKSEDIFKKYLAEEDIDWKKLDDILDEFDGVMLRLKFKYDRPRPFEYFEERGEDIETESAGSPSFPSGHSAFAYFVCDYLSHFLPDRSQDLQKIAELIGQSRIENGVHFPTDVQAGRLVGEQAAVHVLQKFDEKGVLSENEVRKVFVRFLKRRARDLRPNFNNRDALAYYTNDITHFVAECTKLPFEFCHEACKDFLSGYRIELCTENKAIRGLLTGLCHVFYNTPSTMKDMIDLNRLTEGKSVIRDYEKASISGNTFAPASKIEEYVSKIGKFSNKPFVKMAVVNWIAPFETGNEKITNIVLLKETGFNFDITNQILMNDIEIMLENFYHVHDMNNIFG